MTNKFIGQIKEFHRYGEKMPAKEIKLDLTDRKILYLLGENARLSHTFIGKQLKLKRETVAYRIKRMEEQDFLHGYLSLLNPRQLGFKDYLVYCKLKTLIHEKDLLEYLFTIPRVTRLKNCSGTYDLQIVFTMRTEEEFLHLFETFINKYHEFIQSYDLLQIVEEKFWGLNLLLPEIDQPSKKIEQKGSTFQKDFLKAGASPEKRLLDNTDLAILDQLKLNSTISIKELSATVRLAPLAVTNRVSRLIRAGVITHFLPLASLQALGYQWWKIFFKFKNLNHHQFSTFLQLHPQILWFMRLLGKWDYQCSVFAKDNAEFHKVLDEMRTEFADNIINYDSIIVFNQLKYVQRVT